MNKPRKLVLRFFGPPQITVNSKPAEGFDSDKVRALLAFLVVEVGRPHRRERLAGLLWPDYPERSARTNLRRALANLRQVIGDREANPPFLNITRQTIQFNSDSDSWSDVFAFTNLVQQPQEIKPLEDVVALYRGEFLEGFSLNDSAAFDNWSLQQRQSFLQQHLGALSRLAQLYEESGAYQQAITCARRQIELDPYREEGQRQLMRLLARNGQRSDALAQFAVLEQLLAEDLQVQPDPESFALYERIRSAEFERESARSGPQAIRGYELHELIGRGQFGAVYRAHQPLIGREVALKVILPQYADDPDFIRRFEVEAQLVARLEHPSIVPLYDYWREPGHAYLVMRWLRGGSLQHALQHGPWNPRPAAELIDQIASALNLAHRQGIIHRDIKPGNILLDEEGRAYLTDFGLASLVNPITGDIREDITAGSSGSLGYRSPENIRSDPITIQTDIYSLGVVLYELLTARHPFPGSKGQELLHKHLSEPLPSVQSVRHELPEAVDAVIQRATAKNPDERYPDALALSADFRHALLGSEPQRQAAALHVKFYNPYKGLRPFQESDAGEFFGREALTLRLLAHLANNSFMALVGPSGSGKSSVIKAGVIPALRQGGLPGSRNWFIIEMVPGSHPLESLEAALLRVAVNPPESLLQQMREDTRGLLRAIRRALPDDKSRILLFIDQFEEVFTLVEDKEERKHFLDSLLAATKEPYSPLRLVLTLRADYYDRPLQYVQFGELMRQHTQVILPLSADELERAITGPAAQVGLQVEQSLVAEIVADVTDQPGTLPLLQYALTELCELHDHNQLSLNTYRSIGGVTGALAQRAEDLYTKLDSAGQEVTRQIFLRLSTLGDEGEYNRRRVLRTEITTLEDSQATINSQHIDAILDAYGAARLLTFDRDTPTRAPTVEVAHEALLREWDRLQGWLEDNWSGLIRHRQLSRAASEWIGAGELNESFLLRGDRLAQFESWADETQLALSAGERAYLQASIAQREEQAAAERERQEQEARLEERAKFRLRALMIVGALALLVVASLLVITLFFSQEQRQAETLAQFSLARNLIAGSQANLQVDPELSVLLALEAVEIFRGLNENLPVELESLLHQAAQAEAVAQTFNNGGPLAFSPDGQLLAVGNEESLLRVWNPLTGEDQWGVLRYQGRNQAIGGLAFNPGSNLLVTASPDSFLKIWDAVTGEEIGFIERPEGFINVAFNPAGKELLTSGGDGSVYLWDLAELKEAANEGAHAVEIGDPTLLTQTTGAATAAVYSPDGQRVAMFIPGTGINIVDAKSGGLLLEIPVVGSSTSSIAFSPVGDDLASRSGDLDVTVWDSRTGEEIMTVSDTSSITNVAFSPDGRYLATANDNGQVTLWDLGSGDTAVILSGHEGRILDLAFHPNSRLLATSAADGLTRIWDLDQAGSELYTLAAHDGRAHDVVYNADGSLLASTGDDGLIKLWQAETGALLQAIPGPRNRVHSPAFSPDGRKLAGVNPDSGLTIWEVDSGQKLLSLEMGGPLTAASFNEDGSIIIAGGLGGMIHIADALTGERLFDLDAGEETIMDVLFISPRVIGAWGESGLITTWDATSGSYLGELQCQNDIKIDADISPDGRLLAAACSQVFLGEAVAVPQAGEYLYNLANNDLGEPTGVAFNSDGTILATVDSVGVVSLWNTTTGKLRRRVSGPQTFLEQSMRQGSRSGYGTAYIDITGWRPLSGVDISPDGRYLATAGSDGTINVFILPLEDLLEAMRSHLSRDLSDAECQIYLNLAACP